MNHRHVPHFRRSLAQNALLWGAACLYLAGCAGAPPTPTAPTLYQQLGGLETIQRVSHHTMQRVAKDPKNGRSFVDVKLSTLEKSVAAYICKVADGPCVYEGETMKKSHADLKITGSEFDFMVQTLREELDAAQVPQSAKNELLRRLAPTRRDIVAP